MFKLIRFAIILSLAFPALAQEVKPEIRNLIDEYAQFNLEEGGRQQLQTDGGARLHWLQRFESSLDLARGTQDYYTIAKHLGDIYAFSGEFEQSALLYRQVVDADAYDSTARLIAQSNIIEMQMAREAPREKVEDSIDRYREVFHASGKTMEAWEGKELALLDWRQSEYILRHAGRERDRLIESGESYERASEVVVSARTQAARYLDDFLEKIPELSEEHRGVLSRGNLGEDAALFALSRLYNQEANEFDQTGNLDASEAARNKASKYLGLFFDQYSDSEYSRNAAAIYLDVNNRMLPEGGFYEFAEKLLDGLSPNHEVIIALRSIGLRLSGEPNRLESANEVFSLIVETEKTWFPGEYKKHVNYQWALIEKMKNLSELGDLSGAGEILNILLGLEIKGDYLQREFLGAKEKLLTGFGLDVPLSDIESQAVETISEQASGHGGDVLSSSEAATREQSGTPNPSIITERSQDAQSENIRGKGFYLWIVPLVLIVVFAAYKFRRVAKS